MIIGFTGEKGSGKTTAAKALVDRMDFKRIRFAGPMKQMVGVILSRLGYSKGEIKQFLDGSDKNVEVPELGVTPRHLLQTLGTEWGRQHVSKDLWAGLTVRQADRISKKGTDVAIDDCRFPNEADKIHSVGGVIVRVNRPGLSSEDSHKSEKYYDQVPADFTIQNDRSIRELKQRAIRVAASVKQEKAEKV